MTLIEFFGDPARKAAYEEWLRSPITQTVLAVLDESAQPMNMNSTSDPTGSWSEKALYHHGINVGQTGLLRMIREMPAIHASLVQHSAALTPQPNYQPRSKPTSSLEK